MDGRAGLGTSMHGQAQFKLPSASTHVRRERTDVASGVSAPYQHRPSAPDQQKGQHRPSADDQQTVQHRPSSAASTGSAPAATASQQTQSKLSRGPSVISADEAREIFLARQRASARDLAARLAPQFGITAKAIRDIWSLRTWTHITKPYWTRADCSKFVQKTHEPNSTNTASEDSANSTNAASEDSHQSGVASSSSDNGKDDGKAGGASSSPPGELHGKGLPRKRRAMRTVPSWGSLSPSVLETMNDAMNFLDAESEKEQRRAAQRERERLMASWHNAGPRKEVAPLGGAAVHHASATQIVHGGMPFRR